MARLTTVRRERLEKRRAQYQAQLEGLYDLYEEMTKSDVESYTIGSRNVSRFKNLAEVGGEIKRIEERIDEIDAELSGHRRKAVAVILRDV